MIELVFAITTVFLTWVAYVIGKGTILNKLPDYETLVISQTITMMAKMGYVRHEIKNGQLYIYPLNHEEGKDDGEESNETPEG